MNCSTRIALLLIAILASPSAFASEYKYMFAWHNGYRLQDDSKPFDGRKNRVKINRTFHTDVVATLGDPENSAYKFNAAFCKAVEARFTDPADKKAYSCSGGIFTATFKTKEEADAALMRKIAEYERTVKLERTAERPLDKLNVAASVGNKWVLSFPSPAK